MVVLESLEGRGVVVLIKLGVAGGLAKSYCCSVDKNFKVGRNKLGCVL